MPSRDSSATRSRENLQLIDRKSRRHVAPVPLLAKDLSPSHLFASHLREGTMMSAFQKETILSVEHWTDSLFSFTATRDPGFGFQSGQLAMVGLEVQGPPLMGTYSMATANHEDALEFFSIKVADG